jgi:hypothetical protein
MMFWYRRWAKGPSPLTGTQPRRTSASVAGSRVTRGACAQTSRTTSPWLNVWHGKRPTRKIPSEVRPNCSFLIQVPQGISLQRERRRKRPARRKQSSCHDQVVVRHLLQGKAGAARFIINDSGVMLNVRPAPGWSLTYVAMQCIPVSKRICEGVFALPAGKLHVANVLHVLSMAVSQLSLGALAAAGPTATFMSRCCKLWSGQQLVHVTPYSDRCYMLCTWLAVICSACSSAS